jgi:CheY-like chemotaxis protein
MTVSVLIVDDNAEFGLTASRLLQREGLTVVGVASTGKEAVRCDEEHNPDVILVDVDLGEENGIEVAQHLGSARSWRPVVILISAYAEGDLEDFIDVSSAIGFLSKSQLSAAAIIELLDRGDHNNESRPG